MIDEEDIERQDDAIARIELVMAVCLSISTCSLIIALLGAL